MKEIATTSISELYDRLTTDPADNTWGFRVVLSLSIDILEQAVPDRYLSQALEFVERGGLMPEDQLRSGAFIREAKTLVRLLSEPNSSS